MPWGLCSVSALISSMLSSAASLPAVVDMHGFAQDSRRRERPVDCDSDRAGLEGQELCGPPGGLGGRAVATPRGGCTGYLRAHGCARSS